jgi:hypothetical protein
MGSEYFGLGRFQRRISESREILPGILFKKLSLRLDNRVRQVKTRQPRCLFLDFSVRRALAAFDGFSSLAGIFRAVAGYPGEGIGMVLKPQPTAGDFRIISVATAIRLASLKKGRGSVQQQDDYQRQSLGHHGRSSPLLSRFVILPWKLGYQAGG